MPDAGQFHRARADGRADGRQPAGGRARGHRLQSRAGQGAAIGGAGCRVASNVADACRGEAVLTMLADDEAVAGVVRAGNGIAASFAPGALHVSMSTISVALSDRLTEAHAARGSATWRPPCSAGPRPPRPPSCSSSRPGVATTSPCPAAVRRDRPADLPYRRAAFHRQSGQAQRQLPAGSGDRSAGRGGGAGEQGGGRPAALCSIS